MIGHVLACMNEVVSNDYESNHQALDIICADKSVSDVIALKGGIVETVVSNKKNTDHNTKGLDTYGNYIKIKQEDGKTALYAHLKYGSITVKKGDEITKGTVLGTMGETGNAYGKHLHLEIKNLNGNENPIITLNEKIENPVINDVTETEEAIEIDNANEIDKIEENKSEEKTEEIEKKEENIPAISNEQIITPKENTSKKEEYLSNKTYKNNSLVDALKMINVNSSFDNRKIIAYKNGIKNYHGTAKENLTLLNLLKNGNLKK